MVIEQVTGPPCASCKATAQECWEASAFGADCCDACAHNGSTPSGKCRLGYEEHDGYASVTPLNVGPCHRCGNADAPTHIVALRNGERVTLCRDPFACWEREFLMTASTASGTTTEESTRW